MKIVSVTVELKQGLPNYSSRSASATAVADENESLDIQGAIAGLTEDIRLGWMPRATDAEATKALEQESAVPAETPKEKRTKAKGAKAPKAAFDVDED